MSKSQAARSLATDLERRHDTVLAHVISVDVLSVTEAGSIVVAFEGHEHACVGATVALTETDVGRTATVMFLDGDPARPIVTGLLQGAPAPALQSPRPAKLELGARELELTADSKLTLRCGKSCIVLDRDGKVVIRGEHLLSRATSVNRIRGGTILLN
jgi:hypothetical protein